MIICHCGVVSDDDVRRVCADGARTLAQVCRATGAGQDCGSCVFTVKRVLCQHKESVDSPMEVEGAAC